MNLTERDSTKEFWDWYNYKGENNSRSLIYYVGNLALARYRREKGLDVPALVLKMAERGLLILVQRKLGDGIYEYRAKKALLPPSRDVVVDDETRKGRVVPRVSKRLTPPVVRGADGRFARGPAH